MLLGQLLLDQAYRRFTEAPPSFPGGAREAFATTLLAAAAPLVHAAFHRLEQGLAGFAAAGAPFEATTVAGALAEELPARLGPMVHRTLVLEMHVARLRGTLAGATPAARFEAFVEWLRQPEHSLALWREYAAQARLLAIWLDHWVDANLELARRLAADHADLAATFSRGGELGRVIGLRSHLGDAHHGGRTVTVAAFESGERLVYKPRPVASSAHFQTLLGWLEDRGWPLALRPLTVLPRDGYGWVEFVEARPCGTEAAVLRFYQRLGGYLGLLYALRATDFHYQNVIADGEQPILVDLETFLQPPSGEHYGHRPEAAAYQALEDSVVRTGLLPQRLTSWLDAEPLAPDFSGIGGAAGQTFSKGIPQWQGAGTDEMRLVHGRESLQGEQNRPTLRGEPVDSLAYAEDFLAGFTEMYELLVANREDLLAPGGPLEAFAGDEMRIVLRATMVYSMLLKDGRHPDLMRDARQRERHFDRLRIGIAHRPELDRVIPFEHRDLMQDDIPLFHVRPRSRDLWTADGQRIPEYFREAGEALTRQRLLAMGPDDLERQRWLISAALATLAPPVEQPAPQPARPLPARAARSDLVAAAAAIGDRLEALAVRRDGEVGWIGLAPHGDDWVLCPLGANLYSGVTGIALFLAYLGEISGRATATQLAEDALATALREIESVRPWLTLVGAFNGWGGAIYCLAHLGVLWRRPALIDHAEGVAAELPKLIEADEYGDVMAGAAGCLAALLVLHRVRPSERTLALARQCGDRLLAAARPQAQGIGWVGPASPERALTGFAHGAAGTAWALLRLAKTTGEPAYRDTALAAIAYERSLYSADSGNWPDLRPLPLGMSPFSVGWCHGAPGIGMARLELAATDATARREVEAALVTTRREGFGRTHCLCHGDLGNAELVLLAQQRLGLGDGGTEGLAGAILGELREAAPRCGVPLSVETPGLMNGLAGVGYGLLRLAAPERTPSLLLLEPPIL